MSQGWYVHKDGRQLGPFTWEQLWHHVRTGQFQPFDIVWKEGMAGWIPANQVPGLANLPAHVTSPPPPPLAGRSLSPAPAAGAGDMNRGAPLKKAKGMLVPFIIAAVLLLAAGGGAAYYFLLRDRAPAAGSEAEHRQPLKPSPDITDEPEGTDQAASPAGVVDAFIMATLGTVPGAVVDYDKARSLMTADYAASFDSPEFVPQTYGVQDGPGAYEIADGYLEDSTMELIVWGFWDGETAMRWLFILEQEGGAWKIDAIEVMASDDEAAAQTPFWQLNPVATEFTVYQNGGWKLVVEFERPPEDISAHLNVTYYRADDGTVVYAQQKSGSISAGYQRLNLDGDYSGHDLYNLGFKAGMHRVIAYIDGIEIASGELVVN